MSPLRLARPLPLRLGVKLGLVLFLVVAGALAIVYLAVVPRLESRLVAAKVRELELSAPSVGRRFAEANRFRDYVPLAEFFQASLNARVVVLDRLNEDSLIVIADSGGLRSADAARDPVALEAATTGALASGRVERNGRDLAEVAVPAGDTTVVLLSASLRDALATVRLVERSLLLAGVAALVVSWLAGFLLAWRLTRRIHRLEVAAGRIAAGNFATPVHDPVPDEIGQLATAFDRMRRRLERLDHARREFIANASHELRTPLFTLGGFLELLTDEDLDEEHRRDFVREMVAQVERLTKLATDLLDLSRLDAGQLAVERREIDLTVTARTVCEEFRVLAEASGHELGATAVEGVRALGDEQRVLQIARILVENALRHTPAGTAVEVSSFAADGRAALAVRDDGPGIAPESKEHLFDRFYRADGGKASGSGLGLAIARELATRMDGEIELRSADGATVFTLWLPASPAAEDPFSRENVGAGAPG